MLSKKGERGERETAPHLVQVCVLAHHKSVLATQLQCHWRQAVSSSSHHLLANLSAANKHHLRSKEVAA
jgi:hypothetical protein